MTTYLYLLSTFFLILIVTRVIFCEFEGYQAKKAYNMRWYIAYNTKFTYRRNTSIIFMCGLAYILTSYQEMFTMIWLLELLGFVAMGVIGDGLSQILSYYYIRLRFKKDLQLAFQDKLIIDEAVKGHDTIEGYQESELNYQPESILVKYLNEDTHFASLSSDGGQFIQSLPLLPPYTYVVEGQNEQATELLKDRDVKITSLTKEGNLPFKDERIDVLYSHLANYDTYEAYRVLKPGGYILVHQIGSGNYKELLRMLMPFTLKGSWDSENCQQLLQDVGLDICESYEDYGHIRFETLSSLFAFIKKISPERVEKYELFINFYAEALRQIKEKKFYDLSTHHFMVVAHKKTES